ncbi:MAG: isoaspartyl peptidase/L-asparaginase [Actinomycetota bacterium]
MSGLESLVDAVASPVVLVHGGAGARVGEADELAEGCATAAAAGAAVLRQGGHALDAAIAAVVVLEDDPRFNAGTGGALHEGGGLELDASVMEGTGLRAGGVAALPPFRNPIRAARAVLEDRRHVLLTGDGAAELARSAGCEESSLAEMRTPRSIARLHAHLGEPIEADGLDTVGAVALDAAGHLAAATSTGGLVGQRPGRIGDTPVVGAGTWADDRSAAISATGTGEAFLRAGTARFAGEACRLGADASFAALGAMEEVVDRYGGTGGLILVDRVGRLAAVRSTAAMSWAWANQAGAAAHGW